MSTDAPVWGAAAVAITAILSGVALTLVADSIPAMLLVGALAAVPLLAWLASRHPAAGLGLMVALQPLAAFQFDTPIGNPSPSIILLALLLVTNATTIGVAYKTRPLFRTTLWILALWIASHLLRIQYQDAGVVVRQMITLSSFVAAMIAAAALANHRHVLAWTGAGAIVALGALGILGVLASIGTIPITSASAAPRELLGILSPITRSFGLALPNDTLDVLYPLAVSGTLVALLRPDSSWRLRIGSAAGLTAVSLAALLVFQSRSMIVQLFIALVVALWVTGVPFRRLITGGAVILCSAAVVFILQSDPTGTALHSEALFGSVRAVLQDPLAYLVGRSENQLFLDQALAVGVVNASNDNATHNLFLSNLIGGGYVAFALICLAYFRPVLILAREMTRQPNQLVLQVLVVAAAAMLVSVSVQPVRATVIGNWLVLGFIVGAAYLQPTLMPIPTRSLRSRRPSTAVDRRAAQRAAL